MHKFRRLLLAIAHSAVLGIASCCAAEELPSESLWDVSRVNPAHAEEAAQPVGLSESDHANNSWQFGVGAVEEPPVDSEDSLPLIQEQAESQSGIEPAIPAFDDNEENIVHLNGGPPPAYSFGYNRARSAISWLPGDDDHFGWFSYESISGAKLGNMPSLVTGFGIHVLDGPVQTDMPPRLFDFSIGVADRRLIQPNIGYDILVRIGAFSDFEGSARDGVRYPSHAVTFLRLNPSTELVLGIDYLDRDDIHLLPVVGSIWTPRDWLRVEAVFPRPRIAAQIMETPTWIYLGGELGGGTWAIERANRVDDNATYRDLRLVLGWETLLPEPLSSSFEVGYVFDRKLSYSSGIGDYEPSDGFMVRMTSEY